MTVLAMSCNRTSLSVTSDVDMVLLSSLYKSTLKYVQMSKCLLGLSQDTLLVSFIQDSIEELFFSIR